jgi:hypothetical protein
LLNPRKIEKEMIFGKLFTKNKKGYVYKTKTICNKGFSGKSSVVLRSNFRINGQDGSQQSLTVYSLEPLAPTIKKRQ